MKQAVRLAKEYISGALAAKPELGKGSAPSITVSVSEKTPLSDAM